MSGMTPYHQIVEFVTWLREKKASDEDVEQYLRTLESDLTLWSKKIRALEIPSDFQVAASQLIENTQDGLTLFKKSIATVRDYMSARDEALADTAIEQARQALNVILNVKDATEQNIDRMMNESGATNEGEATVEPSQDI